MINVHTLQSDSKTHVHTLQQFHNFFKTNCQICVIVVFNNDALLARGSKGNVTILWGGPHGIMFSLPSHSHVC